MSRDVLATARHILAIESRTIQSLRRGLGKDFLSAVELMQKCRGHIVITGMGKPGFIGRKISATLASTGSPSFYLHPAEAIHGDLGMVTAQDVILAISHSGETEEIVRLLPALKKMGVSLIAMTSGT